VQRPGAGARRSSFTGTRPEVRDVVVRDGVATVFCEVIASPKAAETLADDLGVATAVLDPSRSEPTRPGDHVDVMRANLDALRSGLVRSV
jgi:zinc transport system substrate-binding protein